jgi:hypothetical protein
MHDYLYPMISDVKAFIDIFMAKPATFPEQRLRLGLRHAIGLPDLSHRDQREVSLDPSAPNETTMILLAFEIATIAGMLANLGPHVLPMGCP